MQYQQRVKEYFLGLQQAICRRAEAIEQQYAAGKVFRSDVWQRQRGGGGDTCIIEGGAVFEKAGVLFSHIHGDSMPASATAARPELAGKLFAALGVSVVMHPRNPYVPTSHMNVRFFTAYKPGETPLWWFGGGFDLTPYYVFEEDCVAWHQHAFNACQAHQTAFSRPLYAEYKKACDDYFFLRHRSEARGIGGLFVDDLNDATFDTCFALIRSIGDTYMQAYAPIVERRNKMEYGEAEKQFQKIRRGRYVEFNLVFDRGTLFGLQSGGRTESILMSLPPQVEWHYNVNYPPESREAELLNYLQPVDWLGIEKKGGVC